MTYQNCALERMARRNHRAGHLESRSVCPKSAVRWQPNMYPDAVHQDDFKQRHCHTRYCRAEGSGPQDCVLPTKATPPPSVLRRFRPPSHPTAILHSAAKRLPLLHQQASPPQSPRPRRHPECSPQICCSHPGTAAAQMSSSHPIPPILPQGLENMDHFSSAKARPCRLHSSEGISSCRSI